MTDNRPDRSQAMTTTREAALEAALKEIMSSDSYESRETFDGSSKHVVITKFGGFGQIAYEALAARPAPQPAAEHEYPDPLIAEDRYEDDQPAADTRVVPLALLTEAQDLAFTSIKRMRAGHVNCNDLTMQAEEYVGKLRAIIGNATPAPSDKSAEAAIDRCMQEIEDIICEADVSYPAGRDAGTSIDFDRDAVLAALRALAGKGE